MGFLEYKDCPEAGDTVIVYLNFNLYYPLVLKTGETFQTKYGALRHNDVIGRPYGSRIAVKSGFVHSLWPTPELWTLALPHRTQILYARDISLTLFELDLRPGSVVIESGTGSGSMTHSLARAVAPHGKVLSFDFHQGRSETAEKEFASHGLEGVVSCAHRDVCAEGFGVSGVADAVFLDLPHPWLAVHHAIAALKDTGGRICSFSPCIEQVQRTCEKLRELRCVEVATFECLERPYKVEKVGIVKQNAGAKRNRKNSEYFVKTPNAFAQIMKIWTEQAIKEDDELMAESEDVKSEHVAENILNDSDEKGDDDAAEEITDEIETEGSEAKKVCTEQPTKEVCTEQPTKKRYNKEKSVLSGEIRTCAVPLVKIPGHTGYLTFATFLGRDVQVPDGNAQTN